MLHDLENIELFIMGFSFCNEMKMNIKQCCYSLNVYPLNEQGVPKWNRIKKFIVAEDNIKNLMETVCHDCS